MNKKPTPILLIGLSLVLLVALVGAIGYSLGKRIEAAVISNSTPSSHTAITTTSTPTSSLLTAGFNTTGNAGYIAKYPSTWTIDEERSTDSELVFDSGSGEYRDSIEARPTNQSLEAWEASFDKAIVTNASSLTVDGQPARKVETSEFGLTYIGVRKGDALYIFTTQGNRMVENRMIDLFRFSN